jgi:hypothetical protein
MKIVALKIIVIIIHGCIPKTMRQRRNQSIAVTDVQRPHIHVRKTPCCISTQQEIQQSKDNKFKMSSYRD